MLDERSYRGTNSANRQTSLNETTAWMGRDQIRWLKQQLQRSRATWKVIASDLPLGLMVGDRRSGFDNAANGDGPALGRELEIADLLQWIKRQNIRNVVWLTADVHYAAAHYYNPNRAQFQDFLPFWEFVAGPLNAGTFGPNPLDNTFGPEVKFQSVKPGEKMNRSPKEGFQFFGVVDIDGDSRVMTVSLKNLAGTTLYRVDLQPEAV